MKDAPNKQNRKKEPRGVGMAEFMRERIVRFIGKPQTHPGRGGRQATGYGESRKRGWIGRPVGEAKDSGTRAGRQHRRRKAAKGKGRQQL